MNTSIFRRVFGIIRSLAFIISLFILFTGIFIYDRLTEWYHIADIFVVSTIFLHLIFILLLTVGTKLSNVAPGLSTTYLWWALFGLIAFMLSFILGSFRWSRLNDSDLWFLMVSIYGQILILVSIGYYNLNIPNILKVKSVTTPLRLNRNVRIIDKDKYKGNYGIATVFFLFLSLAFYVYKLRDAVNAGGDWAYVLGRLIVPTLLGAFVFSLLWWLGGKKKYGFWYIYSIVLLIGYVLWSIFL